MKNQPLISVSLISSSTANPIQLTQLAAGACYQGTIPKLGDSKLDVKKKLFLTSHHTTLSHWEATYAIDGIAVGDVTFGLHLTHPFYNTDQRSGRFSSEMFENPDYQLIDNYIKHFWPESVDQAEAIKKYINHSFELYAKYLPILTADAEHYLGVERPKATEKYILANAKKIAQEQLRMFIPIIFPTGLVYTIDLITLVSLYDSAWTPALREATEQMAELLVAKFPDTAWLFSTERNKARDWSPVLDFSAIDEETLIQDADIDPIADIHYPENSAALLNLIESVDISDTAPVDLLHFKPKYMDLNVETVETTVFISVATMGQDQRHRTIKRSEPKFAGCFYLPPLLGAYAELQAEAVEVMKNWYVLYQKLPRTLGALLTPYGSVITYSKKASLNAFIHEQLKRACFCSQEEIYGLSQSMRFIFDRDDSLLTKLISSPCYRNGGHCVEGDRYCGRDLSRLRANPLPNRTV